MNSPRLRRLSGPLALALTAAFARNIDAGAIHGNRFQAPTDMRITELRVKVIELAGTFKCAVYADANGVADRLLAGSVDVLNPANGWNAFPLSAPLDLVGGDWYWLVIWSDTQGARVQADIFGVGYVGDYSFVDLGGEWPDPINLTRLLGDAATRTYCHLRVYALASESGDHTARIWRNADEAVIGEPYTWNYGGTTGWITLDIPDVDLEADTDYTVAVSGRHERQARFPGKPTAKRHQGTRTGQSQSENPESPNARSYVSFRGGENVT
jgi:hypothetical protein